MKWDFISLKHGWMHFERNILPKYMSTERERIVLTLNFFLQLCLGPPRHPGNFIFH